MSEETLCLPITTLPHLQRCFPRKALRGGISKVKFEHIKTQFKRLFQPYVCTRSHLPANALFTDKGGG